MSEERKEGVNQDLLIVRGSWIFWGIVAIHFAPLAWVLVSGSQLGTPSLGTFLQLALLYCLWRGQRWAKWVTIVLYSPLAILLIIAGLLTTNVIALGVGGLIAVVPITLLFSKSLNAFLMRQRNSPFL
jgi:uncharacterized membrane protein (DUF2068 family)